MYGFKECEYDAARDFLAPSYPPIHHRGPRIDTKYLGNLNDLVADQIQYQMLNLIVLASNESKQIRSLNMDMKQHAHRISFNLNRWLQNLAPEINLPNVGKDESTLGFHHNNAIYLIHALFLDTHIILYYQMTERFFYPGEGNGGLDIDKVFSQMSHFAEMDYKNISIQLAQIIARLYDREAIFAQCWIFMYVSAFEPYL
jgi:hypothetical protein